MIKNCWFPFENERKNSDKLLFCFHHAGGTASIYRDWIKWSDEIQVMPVELPGKATRMVEKYAENMAIVAADVSKEIAKMATGKQVWLYGHSMGSVLAFSVTCNLEAQNIKVEKLIVSGRHAPKDRIDDVYQTYMGDEVLIAEIKRVGGTPEEFLENKEILKFILPPLKADYKINESYVYGGQKVNCDILGYAGSLDVDAPLSLMEGWKDVTTGEFTLQEVQGTHFFPVEHGCPFWEKIEREVLDNTIIL